MGFKRISTAALIAAVICSAANIGAFTYAMDAENEEIISDTPAEDIISYEEEAKNIGSDISVAAEDNDEDTKLLAGYIDSEEVLLENADMSALQYTQNADRYIIADCTTEVGVPESTIISVDYENIRLGTTSARLTWPANTGRTFNFLIVKNSNEKAPSKEFNYINMWVYNEMAASSGQLSWVLKTGSSETDISSNDYFRYKLSLNFSGWKLISVPLSSFSKANNGNLQNNVYNITLAANEWAGDTQKWSEAHSINVEKMWFSKEAPAGELSVVSASIEDEAGDVPKDLGGDRTYTVTATGDIVADSVFGKVQVLQDGELLADDEYSVFADGKEIKIVFNNDLIKGSEYVVLVRKGIQDEDGNILESPVQYSFIVEVPSKHFKLVSSSITDGNQNTDISLGADISAGELPTVTFTTNNAIDAGSALSGVKLYKDGVLMRNGYTAEAEGNTLKIQFASQLSYESVYEIKLTTDFSDAYGNALDGVYSFSFTTENAPSDYFDMAIFDSDASLNILNVNKSGSSITTNNAHLYEKSLLISIPKAPTDRLARARDIYVDAAQYNYANYWIYSPIATGKILNLLFYTTENNGNAYYLHKLSVDWTGWRLISISKEEFSTTNSATWQNVCGFGINANGWATATSVWPDGGSVQIERIWFSKSEMSDVVFKGATIPFEASDMPVKDMSVDFVYGSELASCSEGNVVLKEDGVVSDKKIVTSISENTLTVSASDILDSGKSYTIEIGTDLYDTYGRQPSSTVVYSFTTGEFTAGIPKLQKNETTVKAEVSVQNNKTTQQTAAMYLTFYSETGEILLIEKAVETVEPNTEKIIQISSNMIDNAALIKAFVCDGNDSLLNSEYAVYGAEAEVTSRLYGSSVSAKPVASISTCSINGALLAISGSLTDGADTALLSIKKADNTTIFTEPVKVDENGRFECLFDFLDYTSGVYTVAVSGNINTQTAYREISYIDDKDRDDLLSLANSGVSASEFAAALTKAAAALQIDDLTSTRISGIAQSLLETCPYSDYIALKAQLDEVKAAIDKLNAQSWSTLSGFLSDNKDLIAGDTEAYKKYSSYSDKIQNTINQTIVKSLPVDSFTAFREILARAIASYPGDSNKPSGGNSGSSGAGVTVGVSYPNAEKPAVSEEQQEETVFSDVADTHWAKDSILMLYKKGIIAEAADKKFRPDDLITREEFVKLLVTSLNISDEAVECNFADVSKDTWYYSYVARAAHAGIAEGNTDGTFGVGQNITREDMAVMLCRAAGAAGKSFTNEDNNEKFADDDIISDYALSAVYSLRASGIISGMGEGRFAPKDTASRAQAAKIIAFMLTALN